MSVSTDADPQQAKDAIRADPYASFDDQEPPVARPAHHQSPPRPGRAVGPL
jgi:hypothetical protein